MQTNASFGEAVSVAIGSLRSSKLRSFLTLFGIILATTTLISVMAVINGMNRYIAESVSDMGVDGFRIFRMAFVGDWDPKRFLEMQRKNPELSPDEFEYLRTSVTLTRQIGMESSRSTTVTYANETMDQVMVQGVTANIGIISNIQPEVGRFLTEPENSKHLAVAFIGKDLKERLFPTVDAIGKTIQLQGRPFQVIGVAKGLGSVFGETRDSFAMIPIETFFKMFGSRRGISYNALAVDRNHLERAQDEIRSLLRARRHVRPGEPDNFSIVTSDSLVNAWDRMTGAIAATAIAVVSVFMVVGGVVIMNIMLAVVTERTHEIGVRKATGARRQDILNQFLVESSMLSGTGGLIGVILAWIVAVVVRSATPVPMAVPLTAVVVGVGLSMIVGLFFGIYPARRASLLDPIEALRVER